MNLFILDTDPQKIAEYHCEKHLTKMPLESTQMLSSVHRLLDGSPKEVRQISFNGNLKILKKPKSVLVLDDDILDDGTLFTNIYQTAHPGHPVTKWTMASSENYNFHVEVLSALFDEFHKRRGKKHASEVVFPYIRALPKNIPRGPLTPFAQALPEAYKDIDAVKAYRTYYINDKARIATWTNGTPKWFEIA